MGAHASAESHSGRANARPICQQPAGPCLPWDGSSLTPSACSVPSSSPGHHRLPFLRYSQLHTASTLQPVPLMPFWWPKTLEKSGRLPGCCCTAALPGCQRAAGMGDGRAVPLVLAQVYIFCRRFIFLAWFYFLPSLLSLPQRGWDPHSPRVSCSRRCSCPRAVASAKFIMIIFLLLGWYNAIIRMVTTESLGWLPSGGTELGGGDRGERCGFGAGRETSGTRSRCRHPLSVQEAKKQRPET